MPGRGLRRGWFYRVRVGLLSSVLAAVTLWACYDVRDRRARTEWEAPVRVALVVLRKGNVDAEALSALRSRTAVLEARLTAEFQRYRPLPGGSMIQIVPYGPVDVTEAPPSDPGSNLWQRAYHAYQLWRYTRAVDRAGGVPSSCDSRIYVVAEPPEANGVQFVEGFSESRGRVGVAHVNLDFETVDLALFVAAHELLHTLGATDKYGADGRTRFPEGLAAPDQVPLFPQRQAEVMARNRVVSPTDEAVPADLSELRVGRWTAREIGWTN